MKTVIIAALTVDGFISRAHTKVVDWTSKADKQHYRSTTKEIGTVVVGSTTFDTMGRPMPDRRTIIMTRRPNDYAASGTETFTGSAAELHRQLIGEGLERVAIIGGSDIYGQFLSAGLVDELILSIEPKLFGTGITLANLSLDLNVTLLSSELLGENSVILRYQVEK